MKPLLLLLLFPLFFHEGKAQATGTPDLAYYKAYKKEMKTNADNTLIPLNESIPGIRLCLAYGTADNFVHKAVYPQNLEATYLRKPAYNALLGVLADLKKQDLGIIIYDAYRPHAVTRQFWELIKDERYVAHPSKGSNHNRGLAIDLGLYELSTGKITDMGTAFDNFTDTAHHSFLQLPPTILQHRQLLRSVMEAHGFKALETEWWHYSWQTKQKFSVLDIPFRKLN